MKAALFEEALNESMVSISRRHRIGVFLGKEMLKMQLRKFTEAEAKDPSTPIWGHKLTCSL